MFRLFFQNRARKRAADRLPMRHLGEPSPFSTGRATPLCVDASSYDGEVCCIAGEESEMDGAEDQTLVLSDQEQMRLAHKAAHGQEAVLR
jgi:hypothetical protein